jgi:hypothetical protein
MADRRRSRRRGDPVPLHALDISGDRSLLDLVDNLLNQGVVLHGELVLGLGGVDLIYARLSLMLAAIDRAQPRRGGARR